MKLKVIDFYADWCGPCRTISPMLDRVHKSNSDKFDLEKINTDDNTELVKSLGIKGIPFLMFKKGEQVVYTHTGIIKEEAFSELIEKYK